MQRRERTRASVDAGTSQRGTRRLAVRGALIAGTVIVLFAVVRMMTSTGAPTAEDSSAGDQLVLPAMKSPTGREIFVAPDGKPASPGTRDAPVDLATALSSNTPALPGDAILLLGGAYAGNFTSALSGTAAEPFHVGSAPGQRATIVAARLDQPALTVGGSNTWIRDLEITGPGPETLSKSREPVGDVRLGGGVVVTGSSIALVNLVVHDLPKGIDVLQGADSVILAGNVVYFTGWADPLLGPGIRNSAGGDQFVVDNVVFGQGTTGIWIGMSAGDRLLLEGNVSFNNGLIGDFYDRNLLVEGGLVKANDNYTYYDALRGGGENNFGYSAGCVRIEASGNYWAHRAYPLTLSKCAGRFTGNVMIGPVDQTFISRYPDNSFLSLPQTGLRTFVRQNRYDSSRVLVVVFNWDKHAAVNVDLGDLKLPVGATYDVRDVQNYFGESVVTGTYQGGRLNIPVSNLKTVGAAAYLPASFQHTSPEFGAFLLVKTPG